MLGVSQSEDRTGGDGRGHLRALTRTESGGSSASNSGRRTKSTCRGSRWQHCILSAGAAMSVLGSPVAGQKEIKGLCMFLW